MLFCFIVTRSWINSSLETWRPVTELNSWRLTPLKTIRLPFKAIILPFISNLRNPTRYGITSISFWFSSNTWMSKSYNSGASALHNLGCSTKITNLLSLPSAPFTFAITSPSLLRQILTFPFPTPFKTSSKSAFVKVSSSKVRTLMSRTCTSGIVYRYTSL